MSIVIGITGGVGCGKSAVLEVLKNNYDAAVIEADKVGHIVIEPNGTAYDKVVNIFGADILDNADTDKPFINRKALADIVFKDKEKLTLLNSIIHPAVKEYIKLFIYNEESKGTKYIVVEAALLIEAGYRDICDIFWYIRTNKDIRIKRLMENRKYSLEKINSIMNNQLSDKEFIEGTDYIIENNSGYEELAEEIDKKLKILKLRSTPC